MACAGTGHAQAKANETSNASCEIRFMFPDLIRCDRLTGDQSFEFTGYEPSGLQWSIQFLADSVGDDADLAESDKPALSILASLSKAAIDGTL